MKNLILNKSQKSEINDLFMYEGDYKALKKLYEYTGDMLVGMMVDWFKNEDMKSDIYNDQTPNDMFDDLIQYIYAAFSLDDY